MVFEIINVNDDSWFHSKPCENAERNGWGDEWTIELNSLSDLCELFEEVGTLQIVKVPSKNSSGKILISRDDIQIMRSNFYN